MEAKKPQPFCAITRKNTVIGRDFAHGHGRKKPLTAEEQRDADLKRTVEEAEAGILSRELEGDESHCIQCGCITSASDGFADYSLCQDLFTVIKEKSMGMRHGVSFARGVFRDADKNGDGTLTKTEIRKYFKSHPIEKAHILGAEFKWKLFFNSMDIDGDAMFDMGEFVEAVSKVYHDTV